jgi:hypothetical protein
MNTLTIVCAGIALTVIVVSVLSTLHVLSRVSEDDEHLQRLMEKNKENHE